MDARCGAAFQNTSLLMSAGVGAGEIMADQTLAAFLIVRPPVAFIGWGWESDDRMWQDKFLLQPGAPRGLCTSEAPGVYVRSWTNGKAVLDCNKWTASLPFPSL